MIIDLVNKAIKPVMIIAFVSIVITWAFNIQNVLISETTINGIKIKVVDLRMYLLNLTNAWEAGALNFEDILPSRTWEEVSGTIVDSSFWNSLFNNMALMLDWLYFPINFILYIIRWISWLANLALSLIGWNTQINPLTNDYYSTLAKILNWIKTNLFIPYL